MGTGMGLGMWVFWFVVIAVVVLVIKLIIGNTNPGQSGTASEDAMEILRKRYARGEIDGQEFERMKNELKK